MEWWMVCIIIVVSAVSTGSIADKKGYSYNQFALIGLFFPVIGLIVAAVLPDKKGDNAQTLVNYKKLLDEGVISQEEFDEKKRELLG